MKTAYLLVILPYKYFQVHQQKMGEIQPVALKTSYPVH